MSLETELLDIEHRFWEASGDPHFWQDHFNEEGVIALTLGVMDKRSVLQSQDRARPWQSFSIKDEQIVDLGDDAASITYRASARRDGEPEYSAVVTSVYARRSGDWQLMVHQQTPSAG